MFKWIAVVFIIFLFSGCVAPPLDITNVAPEFLADWATIERGDFDTHTKIEGFEVHNLSNRGFSTDAETYFIRSWLSENTERHQLYFAVSYTGEWRFYNGANKLGGEHVETTQIDRDVINCPYQYLGCNHSEIIGISLSRDDIILGAAEGLSFRINTRYANIFSILEIPANYFQGYELVLQKAEK